MKLNISEDDDSGYLPILMYGVEICM